MKVGNRLLIGMLAMALLGATLVVPAAATTLYVTWSNTQNFTVTGAFGSRTFGLGVAHGWVDHGTANQVDIGQVFCVDLMNYTGGSPWAVTARTDGTSWSDNGLPDPNPGSTVEDEYRIGSWGQTAWLANTFGPGAAWNPDKSVALNAAMYVTAYGANINPGSVRDDLNGTRQGLYDGYLAAANGMSTAVISWYDNDDLTQQYFQDFIDPIPEPGALLLIGIGLVGSALVVRRKRRS